MNKNPIRHFCPVNKRILQISFDNIEILNFNKSPGSSFKSYKKCLGCQKFSCVCGEIIRSPSFKLRSILSPNNFKRHLIDKSSIKKKISIGYVVKPNYSEANGIYMPHTFSKKNVQLKSLNFPVFNKKYSVSESKSINGVVFKSELKKSFDQVHFLREKIVNIGIKYLKDPDSRYQRKKLIELLYNLIRKGDKIDYACSPKKKLDEIADYIVKHNQELNFEKYLLLDSDKEAVLMARFDEFLKTFSNNILLV